MQCSHPSSGDSYTAVGFDPTGAQPSQGNVIGNPAFPGNTQVGTPNYAEYLVTANNDTFTELFDFGMGGATIDVNIDPNPLGSIVRTFRQQVEELYLPNDGQSDHSWQPSNTLITTFFGVNDVILVNTKPNASDYTTVLMQSYFELVQDVSQPFTICSWLSHAAMLKHSHPRRYITRARETSSSSTCRPSTACQV